MWINALVTLKSVLRLVSDYSALKYLLALANLLIRAGVELNPGPNADDLYKLLNAPYNFCRNILFRASLALGIGLVFWPNGSVKCP